MSDMRSSSDEDSPVRRPHFFRYGEDETRYLSQKDPQLGLAIQRLGFLNRPVNPDAFSALVESIVGQQISTAACKTVLRRLYALCDPTETGILIPEVFVAVDRAQIQSCGITFRKAEYLSELAQKTVDGQLDFELLRAMDDKDVVSELCKIKGVGAWTAEMLMIHSFERLDILSFADLGIHRGLRMLYGHPEITREQFECYRKRYHPYGSVASVYLWAISAGGLCELDDPARPIKRVSHHETLA